MSITRVFQRPNCGAWQISLQFSFRDEYKARSFARVLDRIKADAAMNHATFSEILVGYILDSYSRRIVGKMGGARK